MDSSVLQMKSRMRILFDRVYTPANFTIKMQHHVERKSVKT